MGSIFAAEVHETRKRSKAEERELLKAEKRNYKDLRWAVDRYPITADEWATLLTLHGKHGKEGGRQLAHQLPCGISARRESPAVAHSCGL